MELAQDANRLQLTLFKLSALMDYTSLMGREGNPKILLQRFEQMLGYELKIDRILFYTKEDDRWVLRLNTNCQQDVVAQINVDTDLAAFKKTTVIRTQASQKFPEIDVIIPLEQDGDIQGYVLLGDTNETRMGVSPIIKHLVFAQTLSMITFVALRNYKLFEEAMRQRELRQELELAAHLQGMLIPKEKDLPQMDGVEIATLYHPHHEVGGDLYDLVKLSDDIMVFCIADVSGKGIPAAMIMTNFQANFRAHVDAKTPLTTLIRTFNERIFTSIEGEKFITLFLGRYDRKRGILEYVNAGQNPPFVYDWDTQTMGQLTIGSMGIGMLEVQPEVSVGLFPVAGNQTLICYTDGLVERRKHGKEVYSTAILEEELPKHRDPQKLVEAIKLRIERDKVENDLTPFDDVSLIALHFCNEES